jgi:hypothetical protein
LFERWILNGACRSPGCPADAAAEAGMDAATDGRRDAATDRRVGQ